MKLPLIIVVSLGLSVPCIAQKCKELIKQSKDRFTGEVIYSGETRASAIFSHTPGVVRSVFLRKQVKDGQANYQARFVFLTEPDQNYTHLGITLLFADGQTLKFDDVELERTTTGKYVYVAAIAKLTPTDLVQFDSNLLTDMRVGVNDSKFPPKSAKWMRSIAQCLQSSAQ